MQNTENFRNHREIFTAVGIIVLTSRFLSLKIWTGDVARVRCLRREDCRRQDPCCNRTDTDFFQKGAPSCIFTHSEGGWMEYSNLLTNPQRDKEHHPWCVGLAGCDPGRSSRIKSGKRGSNSRPSAWEADALPTELLPHRPRRFFHYEGGHPNLRITE